MIQAFLIAIKLLEELRRKYCVVKRFSSNDASTDTRKIANIPRRPQREPIQRPTRYPAIKVTGSIKAKSTLGNFSAASLPAKRLTRNPATNPTIMDHYHHNHYTIGNGYRPRHSEFVKGVDASRVSSGWTRQLLLALPAFQQLTEVCRRNERKPRNPIGCMSIKLQNKI